MKNKIISAAVLALTLVCGGEARVLGSANGFAVLAGSTVTNTGPTQLSGDLGLWPGSVVTGFPKGIIVNGTMHINNAVAQQAQSDLTTAYNVIAQQIATQNLSGQNLGGQTLTAGVYRFDSSAFLTGDVFLDAKGDPNARFDFQIGSTLHTASSSRVIFINGGEGFNVFWQVGSSATLGTDSLLSGNILALTSITLTTGASIVDGSALAINGAVTLDSNLVSVSPVPEPGAVLSLGLGLSLVLIMKRRAFQH